MKRGLVSTMGAVASGVGLALLLPPYDFGGLVWVVLLPLLGGLWLISGEKSGRKALGLGWLAGTIGFLISLHWISVVSPIGWIALSIYLGGFIGLWGMIANQWAHPWARSRPAGNESRVERRIREKTEAEGASDVSHWRQAMRSLQNAFVVAAVWCGLEWLRGWLFTGFGWNPLATAFHRSPVMAQSADLLGLVGLSFVPVFLQAVLVQTARRMWVEARAGRLRPHVDFGVAALLVALGFCYGVWRLHTEGKGDAVRLRALLVQLNIPQDAATRLWSPEAIHLAYEEETLKAIEAIEREDKARLKRAIDEGGEFEMRTPDWVMWPESSLTGRVMRAADGTWGMWDENMVTLSRIREAGDFLIMMGLNELEGKRFGQGLAAIEDARIWNSLVMLSPDDELQTYRKNHLVIFGEYIPLVEQLPFLKKLYEQQSGATFGGSFSSGGSFEPLPVMIEGESVGLVPTVCFEDTVPRLMRKFVRGGPQLIVNVTNDGWFKDSPAAAQHFANAKFRAIELRRPMLRCANSGVSAAVSSTGTTAHPDTGKNQEIRDAEGNHLTRGWMLAEVDIPLRPTGSLYGFIGDWGVIGLGLLGLITGVTTRRRASA